MDTGKNLKILKDTPAKTIIAIHPNLNTLNLDILLSFTKNGKIMEITAGFRVLGLWDVFLLEQNKNSKTQNPKSQTQRAME